MTLPELAGEYLYGAQLLTEQIEALLVCRRTETDCVRIREINRLLQKLRAIRREERNIADFLLHYYEKGGPVYEEYRV